MRLKIEDWKLKIFDISISRGLVISIVLTASLSSFAQSDSALNRSVTVERDFQPVIQSAGKVATKPTVVETTIEPAPVEYSDYTASVSPESSVSPLLSQPTRFEAGKPYHGWVRGAIGHPNTLFGFGYHLNDGKNSILDVYANHHAEWGMAALSKTKVGLNFKHTYSTADLYFGINGGNIYYHKYGHWYDYSQQWGMWEKNERAYANIAPKTPQDITSLWTAEAYIGIKSNAKQDVQYKVQTGYMLFAKPGAVSEHQVRTYASLDWHETEHHAGANIYVQNNFMQLGSLAAAIPDSMYNSRHCFRIEPYYEYKGKRVRVHVGVNLDMNLGCRDNEFIGTKTFCFAPSPHINLEAQVAKQWLTVYADIEGRQGILSLQHYMEENRYRLIHAGIIEPHAGSYTPVDAEVGLHIRPHRDLLVEVHGGYAYMMNQDVWIAHTAPAAFTVTPASAILIAPGDYTYFHTKYQRGKVGGQVNYHYRDIVRVNLAGDYFIWSGDTTVYDRPNWKMSLRIDGRIDKHWSLYSDNHFAGSRKALAYNGLTNTYTDYTLAPTIDLNLGLQYDMWVGKGITNHKSQITNGSVLRPEPKPNLTLFFQLNNWLHRKNEILYGYRSQGINFLLGATFRF